MQRQSCVRALHAKTHTYGQDGTRRHASIPRDPTSPAAAASWCRRSPVPVRPRQAPIPRCSALLAFLRAGSGRRGLRCRVREPWEVSVLPMPIGAPTFLASRAREADGAARRSGRGALLAASSWRGGDLRPVTPPAPGFRSSLAFWRGSRALARVSLVRAGQRCGRGTWG